MKKIKSIISRSDYLSIFYSILVLLLFIKIFDFSIGNILRVFYHKQTTDYESHVLCSMEKTKEDILIFGSSRAYHHYHPLVISKELSHTCFNNGLGGRYIFYHYMVLKSTLVRYSPKFIILDLIPEEFSINHDFDGKDVKTLLPFYKDHKEIRPIINLKDPTEKYKLFLSDIYPFNSSVYTIFSGDMGLKHDNEINGYFPLHKKLNQPIITVSNNFYQVDSTKLHLYNLFINDCIHSNVKLLIVCSPHYYRLKQEDLSLKIGKLIAKQNNVPFYDFSEDSVLLANPKYFEDEDHLNNDGAILFTSRLISKIKSDSYFNFLMF